MANKISTKVLDSIGNEYSADVYVEHDANVNGAMLQMSKLPIVLSFYKSQALKESGYAPFTAISAPPSSPEPNLPTSMPVLNMFMMDVVPNLDGALIQAAVTAYLKGIYGDANVSEV